MTSKALLVAVGGLLAAVIVVAGPTELEPQVPIYGFDVSVAPDKELADFVQCGLIVFELETEESVAELPSLVIMSGDTNSMVFNGVDGVEVTFECTINREMTEASYEIAGRRDGQLVLNHLATIRLQ